MHPSRSEALRAHRSQPRLGFTLDPYARMFSTISRRAASHTLAADATATARGADYTATSATRGVRATSKTPSANRTVPTAVATSIGEVGAQPTTVGDAATANACIAIYQATPDVTSDIAKDAVAN